MKKDDEKQLIDLLRQLEPGFLPFEIFLQIARITTLSIIEFVPLRKNFEGQIEVLLLDRGDSDPIWPNALHTPGTVIRPTDTESTKHLAFLRITEEELKETKASEPHFVGSILHTSKRGAEHAQIYWVQIIGEPKVGKFYPASDLPVELINSQRKFISLAVKSYEQRTAE